jgi:hypothetical protein
MKKAVAGELRAETLAVEKETELHALGWVKGKGGTSIAKSALKVSACA